MTHSSEQPLRLTTYKNASSTLLGELKNIMRYGERITVRDNGTREVESRCFQITSPLERCVVMPHRSNNIFATIAESVWVMAGRNDVSYLENYLPRAADFSDDGKTWRAGYGPRIRDWNGIDQVREIYNLLKNDQNSRRAVMTIFDPDRDFVKSKDIPCNNWLHWTVRNNKLNLSVAVRSNDIIWGFSGINTFEWSLLQEMLAGWLKLEVGVQTYFIGSLHLYDRHEARAAKLVRSDVEEICYTQAPTRHGYEGKFDNLKTDLDNWFSVEEELRIAPVPDERINSYPDPLLRDYLFMLRAYWVHKRGASPSETRRYLSNLKGTDLEIAANEYFERVNKT